MKEFIDIIIRELKRIRKEPVVYGIIFLAPVFSFFLIASIFKTGVPRDLPVGIVDLDASSLSRKAARMVDATPIAKINKNYISLLEAREAIEHGEVAAVLYFPKGTERNILRGQQSSIVLYVNNANVIKGSLLSSGIQKTIQTLSTGIKIQTRLKTGESEKEALAKTMPVKINSELLSNPFLNYSYFITFVLFPVMLVLFSMFATIYAIGSEFHNGTTIEWMQTAGDSIVIGLTGKLLLYTLFNCATAMFMNYVLFKIIGAPLHGSMATLFLSELLLIFSYQSMAIILVALTANLRLSLSLASAYSLLGVTYAGFSFPISAMPAAGKFFSRIFPISYWIESFVGQSLRAAPLADSFIYFFYLGFFIILGIFFLPRLKYISFNKNYWGKI
ncbi:MAG TPA: ABC transporter permease [Niabella sp.]|nr:ABC transporter permease [Chitinophagaceae bacterium]HRN47734.1 ABC transporter permease [Niabella sp.]HRO85988.1 ABC transporter permease [Niabella sp.]